MTGVNSLYFTATQLVIDAQEQGKEPDAFQFNRWTFDNLVDEIKLFSPDQLDLKAGRILDVDYFINDKLKDTEIVLILKKDLDKPSIVLVK